MSDGSFSGMNFPVDPTEPRAEDPGSLVEEVRAQHIPLENDDRWCARCTEPVPCRSVRLADALAAEIEAQKQYLATTLEQQAGMVVALNAASASAANSNKLLVASEQLAERLLGERNQARAEADALLKRSERAEKYLHRYGKHDLGCLQTRDIPPSYCCCGLLSAIGTAGLRRAETEES